MEEEVFLVRPVEEVVLERDPGALEMAAIDEILTRIGLDPEKDGSAAGVYVVEHEYA